MKEIEKKIPQDPWERGGPIGKHVKMFRQIRAPPGHVKDRAYPKKKWLNKMMFRDTVD